MRVLVISADQALERFLNRELSPRDFEVLGVRHGPALVEVARAARPEIAVIHCVEGDRQTTALEHALLRAMLPHLKTILVSTASTPADGEIVEAGVFYYMIASPPLRLPDVVRAAARSIREASDKELRQGAIR